MFIAPWQAGQWARLCPVSIRFRYQYPVKLRYCGSNGALCRAARKVGPDLERRYHAYSIAQLDAVNAGYSIYKFRLHTVLTVEGRVLVDRARRIAEATAERRHAAARIPSEIPAYFSFFPLRLEHRLYLGAATGEGHRDEGDCRRGKVQARSQPCALCWLPGKPMADNAAGEEIVMARRNT